MAWYDPGKQVVCVKRGAWKHIGGTFEPHAPQYREICTVTAVGEWMGHTVICLAGYGPERKLGRAFFLDRFRPVQPLRNRTETGMALIRTALNTESDKTPVPVKENV